MDVYISVPEKPADYAVIRTQEDLGSLEKAAQEPKQEVQKTASKKERGFIEKRFHHISQSLQFFGVRMKSKWNRLVNPKKKK